MSKIAEEDRDQRKSLTMTVVLSVSPFMCIKIWFTCLVAPMLGVKMFTRVIFSCWIVPLLMEYPSLSPPRAFVLKSILPDRRIATPPLFSFHLHEISFPPLYFQSVCLFNLRCVLWRQYILIYTNTIHKWEY